MRGRLRGHKSQVWRRTKLGLSDKWDGQFLPKLSKMWKIGLEGRQTSADKTTPKLVTEQLRASQKVLNKSDQFIPVVLVARGGAGGARAAFASSTNEKQAWARQPIRSLEMTPQKSPSHTGHPGTPSPLLRWVRNSSPGAGFKCSAEQERPTGQACNL